MGFQSMRFSWCGGDHPETFSIEPMGVPGGGGADSRQHGPPALRNRWQGAGRAMVPDAPAGPILSAWWAIGGMVPWALKTLDRWQRQAHSLAGAPSLWLRD